MMMVVGFCMDMNHPGRRSSGGYYYHHHNKSKVIFGLGFHDPKYYDQIITKLNLQTRKQQHERSLPQDQTTVSSSNNKRRILLVDDEPDICMVYQMALEDAGYQCISYTDSIKALQEFKPYLYDLILLDIKMPMLNGFELCKKIIELDRTVHIIFITAAEAYYKKFRSQDFPELGNINYIQKPIGNDELVRIVNMIVSNSITTKD
jgi:CheY-like chemotaxis protein